MNAEIMEKAAQRMLLWGEITDFYPLRQPFIHQKITE